MTLRTYTISGLQPVIFREDGVHLTSRGKSILANNFVTVDFKIISENIGSLGADINADKSFERVQLNVSIKSV